MTVALVMEGTGEIYDFPEENVAEAVKHGYRLATEAEVSQYDADKAYQANTTALEREVYGAGVGATTQLLGLPALGANMLPGVEDQSGGSWLAKFASEVGGMSPEEAETALRTIAEQGSTGHFVGAVGGSLLGTKGLSVAGKAAQARLAAKGVETGAKAAAGANVAESVAQNITIANEQAFLNDRELSAEMILSASALGAIGPLALGPGLNALRAGGKKVLGKLDDVRMEGFKAATGKTTSAEIQAARKRLDDAIAADRELNMATAGARKEMENLQKAMSSGEQVATPAMAEAVQAARTRLNAAKVTASKHDLKAAQRAFDDIQQSAPGARPVKFADLFSSDRVKRLETLAGAAEEAAGKFDLSKAALGATKAAVRGGTGVGWGSKGGLIGALSMDGLMGAAAGGLGGWAAGEAVRRFGPKASGWALTNMAQQMRTLSAAAAKASTRPAKRALSPASILVKTATAAGNQYRTRLLAMAEDAQGTVKAAASNPELALDTISEAYGELGNDMVRSVTQRHMVALSYLAEAAPKPEYINPMLPAMGKMSVPIGELESYVRKVEAVMDPTVALRDLVTGSIHSDTIEAVRSVYPSMYAEMELEVMKELSDARNLTKEQAIAFDKFLGGEGLVYGASNPGFQARLGMANEMKRGESGPRAPAAPSKPGRPTGRPTLGQSMRTGSQRAAESIGN